MPVYVRGGGGGGIFSTSVLHRGDYLGGIISGGIFSGGGGDFVRTQPHVPNTHITPTLTLVALTISLSACHTVMSSLSHSAARAKHSLRPASSEARVHGARPSDFPVLACCLTECIEHVA